MEFTLQQAEALVNMFQGEREETVTVVKDDESLKAYYTECPEEGLLEL